jgi:NADH:ubiquinone oxidoreductase subunit 4 (subunit M)
MTICSIGCIYTALIALSQIDMKKVIAYSSVSHMNFCLLGIISGNSMGMLGSFLMAIGHGIVSTALFFLIGIIYERSHTRLLDYYSGLGLIVPVISFFSFMFLISNFGFPISLNFVAELLILVGVGSVNILILIVLILYSVFSVAYNL